MKNVKCYSVRLKSLVRISDKAYRAECYDGSSDIIPASQVIGPDMDVEKSEAWWITAWILEKKSIQYSAKKVAFFDDNGKMLPTFTVEKHTPERKEKLDNNIIYSLKK